MEEVDRFQAVINSQLSGIFSDELKKTIDEFLEQIEREQPGNWPPRNRYRWSEMSSFVQETRWPIVWVPRMEIVERLIAPGINKDEVLLSARMLILDDCVEVFNEIAGAWSPAQAMSAAILTTVLELHRGLSLSKARKELESNPDEASIGFIRFAFILSCVPWQSRNIRHATV